MKLFVRIFVPIFVRIFVRIFSLTENTRLTGWPLSLRHWSEVDHLLGLRVQIPSETWSPVSCEGCVLSGRGLCDKSIPRPEEFY